MSIHIIHTCYTYMKDSMISERLWRPLVTCYQVLLACQVPKSHVPTMKEKSRTWWQQWLGTFRGSPVRSVGWIVKCSGERPKHEIEQLILTRLICTHRITQMQYVAIWHLCLLDQYGHWRHNDPCPNPFWMVRIKTWNDVTRCYCIEFLM